MICGSTGEQLGGVLRGLVLLQAGLPQPWERVVALGLSSRPSDPISHTLYFEAMGRCDPQGPHGCSVCSFSTSHLSALILLQPHLLESFHQIFQCQYLNWQKGVAHGI